MENSDLSELIDSSHFIDSTLKERSKEYFRQIPDGLGPWFYTSAPILLLSQGDILDKLDVVYFAIENDSQEMRILDETVCMLLSNTCDMNFEGKTREKYVSVAPVFDFEEFARAAKTQSYTDQGWQDFLKDLKANAVTDVLYIPESGSIKASVVFLDKICSMDAHILKVRLEKNESKKILSLSPFGFYFFLIKLTHHFARFEDRTEVKRE